MAEHDERVNVTVETDPQPEDGPAPEEQAAEAPATEPVEAEVMDAEPTLAQLQAERDDLFQRLARVSAEFENFQKRVKRDKAMWSVDARRGLIESMLPVLDNLDFAVAAFDREVKDPDSLRKGVELVREELLRQLANNDLKPIEPTEGDDFDADLHQAIAMEPADVESEVVSFVARKGYKLAETVLRPAQVGVRKPQ